MRRHRVSGGEAFATLVRTSQDTNVKLRDVARHVVEHAERTAARARRNRPELGSENGLEYAAVDAAS